MVKEGKKKAATLLIAIETSKRERSGREEKGEK